MIIDNKQLHEKILPCISDGARDEHYYQVPGASNYYISDYGTLRRQNAKGRYRKVKLFFSTKLASEAYRIKYDGEDHFRIVSVSCLMRTTFYPNESYIYLSNPRYNPFSKDRWFIGNLHPLTNRELIVESIMAKIEHREPQYPETYKGATFINRIRYGTTPFREYIEHKRSNIISRSCNPNVKKKCPQYRDTTVDPEIVNNPEAFKEWMLSNYYEYDEPLQIDKDILSFGETNCYSLDTMALVPARINYLFRQPSGDLGFGIRKRTTKGSVTYRVGIHQDSNFRYDYYEDYEEALKVARQDRAKHIRTIVAEEQAKGLMPEHILACMEEWAVRCENGLVKMWEPRNDSEEDTDGK